MHLTKRPLRLVTVLTAAALTADTTSASNAGAVPLTTVRVASGLSSPLYVTAPPGDTSRIFIVEQGGDIEILKNGVQNPTPFIDLTAVVSIPGGSERGLLGLAFHPDYENNGFFYVSYTRRSDGASIVSRYSVTANPDVADPGSASVIFGPVSQPFSNHNGGCIQFGPDGKLYLGLGDGGSANDPSCNAQNPAVLLGKLIRMEDDGSVPVDNPFVGVAGYDPLIWSLGVRNPWRFSFDRATGDFWLGDVGQNQIEEVDFVAAADVGGQNFAWKIMEGNNCFSTSACSPSVPLCNDPSFTDPIYTYTHVEGCSITGGYVYRGCAMPGLHGTYFFADFCSNRIWTFEYDGVSITNFQNRTPELAPNVGSIGSISSFGEDALGEIYIVDIGGEVFKVMEVGGDCNGDTIADVCQGSSSVVRNGGGTNPLGFAEVTPPILGGNWGTTIDIVTPGALASIVSYAGGGPTSGLILNTVIQGELLGLPPFLNDVAAGVHSLPIPPDCALLGQTLTFQGSTFQPGLVLLNNAIDATIGTF